MGNNTFFIKDMERQNKIYHAENLIKETFGEVIEIQLI